jgi:hypothetical protein
MEQMLGSYGPSPNGEVYTKNFDPEESPSGLLARSGSYNVRSRVVDDDGEVYAGLWFFQGLKANLIQIQIGSGPSSLRKNGLNIYECLFVSFAIFPAPLCIESHS